MSTIAEVSADTTHEQLVARFTTAQKRLADAKAELEAANVEHETAQNELVRWISPSDARQGCTYAIWHGDKLLDVYVSDVAKDGSVQGRVTVRKRRL